MRSRKVKIGIPCLVCAAGKLNAEGFSEQLDAGKRLTYEHRHIERGEVTGFTYQEFIEKKKGGTSYLLEAQENVKPDGTVFTSKTLWFELPQGIPKKYVEEDFRENLQIVNTYEGNKVRTHLSDRKNQQDLNFEEELKGSSSVSFEVILPFIRKHFQEMLDAEKYLVTLYLPVLAIELERTGLPRSMSLISMRVRDAGTISWESELGNRRGTWLEMFPESFMLRSILPKEKSHFRFLIDLSPPHYILEFEEGGYRHTLVKLEEIEGN